MKTFMVLSSCLNSVDRKPDQKVVLSTEAPKNTDPTPTPDENGGTNGSNTNGGSNNTAGGGTAGSGTNGATGTSGSTVGAGSTSGAVQNRRRRNCCSSYFDYRSSMLYSN